MARYIDADKLKKDIRSNVGVVHAEILNLVINKQPTFDVAEVKHSKNISQMHPVDEFICSECGLIMRDWQEVRIDEDNEDECYYEFEFKYCPNCGAKMDGEK